MDLNDSAKLFFDFIFISIKSPLFLIKDRPPRMGSLVKLDNSLTLRIFSKICE